jgi:hypothetical protein
MKYKKKVAWLKAKHGGINKEKTFRLQLPDLGLLKLDKS